ncbi:MAG TPA: M56 family metallopeptidase [Terriglobales bacterium]|nr:M56 family metallopeptidase [Terriglobales bacterium]
MNEWLASVGPAVADHLWQSTVFAVAATLLTVLLKKNQARIRYWIWLAALMKFLLPFSLLIGLGAMLPRPKYASVTTLTAYTAMDTMSEPFAADALPVTPTHVVRSMGHKTPEAVASVWLCGFVVVLAVWWIRWRRVAAIVREATEASAGRELETLRRLERDANMLPVRLLLSQSSMEPGMFGVIRPVLLWPQGISARLSDGQVESILAHELCHVRRRDNLFAMAQMVVHTVFWFYPPVWWIGAGMVEERERACDEEVLGRGSNAEMYAESVLKICEFCLESPLVCVSGITGADLKRRIVQIMARHFGRKLSLRKKLILAMAGLVAIAGPVAFGVVRMTPLHMQILHATGPLPSYEVATIKPEVGPHIPANLAKNVRRFTGTTKDLIEGAYNIPYGAAERVVGGPSWISSDRYIIEGKVPEILMARMATMEGTESRMQNSLMKQSLLAERFKLKVHFEMRELPVYALVVAKGGPKMKPTDPSADVPPLYFPPLGAEKPNAPSAPPVRRYMNTFGPNHRLVVNGDGPGVLVMNTNGVALDNVAQSLEEAVDDLGGRTIVNRTGLDGQYDFTLKWATQQIVNPQSEDSAPADAPSIFTALEEQLGLKLVPAKGMVEVVVIDSIERPSEN